MNRTLSICGFAVAILAIVSGALYQGKISERWTVHPELDLFAERLEHVPLHVGDWSGEEGEKMDATIRKAAGAIGDKSRKYRNDKTGQEVQVFLICGRLTDVIQHTPDRCYPAAGFESLGDIKSETVPLGKEKTATFSNQRYQKKLASGSDILDVYWAFASNGKWNFWQSPENPRADLAGAPAVYKLYVVNSMPQPKDGVAPPPSASIEFLTAFLPVLDKILLANDDATTETASAVTSPAK